MEIKINYIPHNFRNKYLKNTSGYASSSSSNVSGGNGLPYVLDENGNYVVEKQVLFKKSIISKEEVVAYGESDIDYVGVYAPLNHTHGIDDVTGLKEILDNIEVGSGGTASIEVIDSLDSVSSTAALSARQGRILSELIADKGSVSSWADIKDKPLTFPPSTHNHSISDVSGLQGQLDGKASSSHSHVISGVTGLSTELSNKANVNHSHSISAITNLQAELNKKSDTAHTHDNRYYTETEINSLLAAKASSSHTHTIANISNLQAQLDSKAASSHSHAISAVTGLQTQLDSKASGSHSHSISGITGLQGQLDSKAASSHTHTIANVTNLQAELNKKSNTGHTHDDRYYTETEVNNLLAAKASSSHTHTIANITNLQIELNNKSNNGHTHVISAITGLQTQLDSKVNSSDISTLNVKNSDTVDNLHASSFMRSDTDTTCTGTITCANLVSNGEVTSYSDKRLKTDIRSLDNRGLLNPVVYTKDNKRQIGFIAQEVQEHYPELVSEDANGYLSLNYQQLTAVLSSQINDLYLLIDELKLKITELKNEIK